MNEYAEIERYNRRVEMNFVQGIWNDLDVEKSSSRRKRYTKRKKQNDNTSKLLKK